MGSWASTSAVAEEVSIDVPIDVGRASSLVDTDAAVPGALEIPTINLETAR